MRIQGIKVTAEGLLLEVTGPEARSFAEVFQPGDYTIERERKRRSLDANAYAWVLMDKIAGKLGCSTKEVYRRQLDDIGGISQVISVEARAVESFKRLFLRGHLGRDVIEQPSQIPGHVTLICRVGSSDFDTRQMSQLIDNLVQDAKTLGIETDTGRIRSLLEAWE